MCVITVFVVVWLRVYEHGEEVSDVFQVMWLGYPGTSGAPFMDYIMTDKMVVWLCVVESV